MPRLCWCVLRVQVILRAKPTTLHPLALHAVYTRTRGLPRVKCNAVPHLTHTHCSLSCQDVDALQSMAEGRPVARHHAVPLGRLPSMRGPAPPVPAGADAVESFEQVRRSAILCSGACVLRLWLVMHARLPCSARCGAMRCGPAVFSVQRRARALLVAVLCCAGQRGVLCCAVRERGRALARRATCACAYAWSVLVRRPAAPLTQRVVIAANASYAAAGGAAGRAQAPADDGHGRHAARDGQPRARTAAAAATAGAGATGGRSLARPVLLFLPLCRQCLRLCIARCKRKGGGGCNLHWHCVL